MTIPETLAYGAGCGAHKLVLFVARDWPIIVGSLAAVAVLAAGVVRATGLERSGRIWRSLRCGVAAIATPLDALLCAALGAVLSGYAAMLLVPSDEFVVAHWQRFWDASLTSAFGARLVALMALIFGQAILRLGWQKSVWWWRAYVIPGFAREWREWPDDSDAGVTTSGAEGDHV